MIGPDLPAHLLASSSARSAKTEENRGQDASTIGPTIPTHLGSSARSTTPIPSRMKSMGLQLEEEEEDYAPALPPDMIAAKAPGAAQAPTGPARPPHLASRRSAYDEDDEDDDYGPTPLPSGFALREKSGVEEFLEREERRKKQLEEASKPKALQREEWMLVPPSQSDLLGSIDPTRIKRPRKFAATAQTPRDADASLWTETPAERQQRIADEVAGKRRRVTDVSALNPEEERELRKKRRYEEEVRKGVEEHTKKVRGGTLVDRHARTSTSKEKDDDDELPVIWDHSRDMALSGRLVDDKTRDKVIREARGLGDRFGSGKSGGFL
ncbi:uncharacterized protein B0H18DRAFT_881187 [Fomitopsis serialis]|uniref:uncharacterized protein n=1 Tax=Fomitopsis serialis TaxID=139415 RepID=UPI0020084200|nr:uncharacterized protein B0H18DRAFT_881187 [Neoantrodia serialis]KAH9920322.1 hypothetical protein B0H18DRAFT_881187 [Neoantrodia serialis]